MLRRAIDRAQPNAHVLVVGPPGTGRRTALKPLLEKRRTELPRPSDSVYLWSSGREAERYRLSRFRTVKAPIRS